MSQRLIVTILLGGIAALDATPVAQSMLSQPLIMGTLLGLLWGDMRTALEVAIILQIFAVSTMPVGARTPEDYAVGGVVGVGLALALASQQSFEFARQGAVLFGVLAGMLTASFGVRLLKWQRHRNEALSRWCEAEIRGGGEDALARSQLAAVALAFGIGVLYTAVCIALGAWGFSVVVAQESLWLSRAWRLMQPLLIGIGLAHLLSAFVQRRLTRAALFGFSLIGTWLLLMLQGL